MAKVKCVDCGSEFDNRDFDYRVRCMPCYLDYRDSKVNPFARKATDKRIAIPKEWDEFLTEIPALLQLCHPDKHSESGGSKRVTSWLLKVKKKHAK